jgi:hypothetical protein
MELLRGGCNPSPKKEQSQCDDNEKPHPLAKGSDLSKWPVFSRRHFEVRMWNTMRLFRSEKDAEKYGFLADVMVIIK